MIKSWSLVGALLFAGCSVSVVNSPALIKSQKAYESVRDNVQLKRYAAPSLFQAGKLYTLSKSAADNVEAEHFAYLLDREIAVAKESAKEKLLAERLAALQQGKTKALLEAKEQEVTRAKEAARAAEEEARAAAETARALEIKYAQLQELNAKMTNRGLVLTLGDVLFATDQARLMAGAARAMDKLVQFLKDNPERKVLIEGHTDNVGNTTYNIDLSLRRADAVARALSLGGIEDDRIVTKGYGERYPVVANSSAAGRQQNRRVEIVILNEGESIESVERRDDLE
jgi:outer membrane protein OmpA-like peptidoglycan-associated protein